MSNRSFFEQFLDDYFAECDEHLTSARTLMLSIESAGANKPVASHVLDELLRNFHSLKGLSAMVGLEEATQLAHHIEDYLKELKRPETVISAEGLDRVVAGISTMEAVIEAKRKSVPFPDVSMVLLHLAAAAEEIRTTEESHAKNDANVWRFLFRSSQNLADRGINVNVIREQLRRYGDVLHAAPLILEGGQIAFEFTVSVKVPESEFQTLRSYGVEYSRLSDNVPAPAAAEEHPIPQSDASKILAHNFIRVEMNRLDDLMRIAGELVMTRFQLDEVLRKIGHKSEEWNAVHEINAALERQLRELREKVVRSRMVPIGQVFERMRFVIRGLERELNKSVDLRIDGHDTEIDKVVVERMMDPLLHLVRNAISHGIETPEERTHQGKPERGSIHLAAKTVGDVVVIEVEDDGRGVNTTQVLDRARTLGWTTQNELLDPPRLLEILSTPGFTTRDEADLTSGRGIGMAAVKTAVGELGGSMYLNTIEGRGTQFTIRLPLTLLITDSLMVAIGPHRFAVPQTAIQEVLAVECTSVKAIQNNEMIPFRGGVLPLIRLSRVFKIDTPKQERLHVLVIANGNASMGLAVDRITGQREIVVRSITDPLLRVPGIVGATELGDGRPVLILDPQVLVWKGSDFDSMEAR